MTNCCGVRSRWRVFSGRYCERSDRGLNGFGSYTQCLHVVRESGDPCSLICRFGRDAQASHHCHDVRWSWVLACASTTESGVMGGAETQARWAQTGSRLNRQLGRSDSARATSNDQNYFFLDFLAFLTVFFAFFAFLAFFAITSLIGFELTSTSRGVLGDRPVCSLGYNPNRFVEICRLFFSVVPKS